jgi:hypothetical protein
VAEIDISTELAPRRTVDANALETVAALMERGRAEASQRRRSQRRWGGALLAASLLVRPLRGGRLGLLGFAAAAGLLLMSEQIAANELAGYEEIRAMLRRTLPG